MKQNQTHCEEHPEWCTNQLKGQYISL